MAKKSIFAWIPEELHRELKAKLSQEGKTIQWKGTNPLRRVFFTTSLQPLYNF